MTKIIPLTRGYEAIVDDEDFEIVGCHKWHAMVRPHTVYAVRMVRGPRGRRTQLMHSALTGWPMVDHRDGNGLNNTRGNLRSATESQNQANRRIGGGRNKSGFKGVSWHKRFHYWQAQIRVNGRHFHLGTFADPEEAAREYDAAAVVHFGEFARINFPTPQGGR